MALSLPRPCPSACGPVLGVVLLLLLPAAGPALWAQSGLPPGDGSFRGGISTGVGYTGVLPDALAGGGAFHLLPSRSLGFFADVKFTPGSVRSERDFCPSGARPPAVPRCTLDAVQNRWNDIPLRDLREHRIVNGGLAWVLTEELAFLLGGGLARSERYWELSENIDRQEGEEPRVSEFGVYFVPEEENPGWTPQLVVGALLRAGPRFVLRVGYETAPGGMSLGAYFVLR